MEIVLIGSDASIAFSLSFRALYVDTKIVAENDATWILNRR